jgi:pre-mRNA-splicing factor ISY1
MNSIEWEEMCAHLRSVLGLPEDTSIPDFPLKSSKTKTSIKSVSKAISDKLKPPDAMQVDSDPQKNAARMLASYIPFFEPEELMPPNLPSRGEMEGVLLELRKRALVGEYFGNE